MDAALLSEAYASPNGLALSSDGTTLAVSGTDFFHGPNHLAHDLLDDLSLPMANLGGYGGATHTYKAGQIREFLRGVGSVTTLIGHSLGGAASKVVAEERQLEWRGYGVPAVTWQRDGRSHRHWYDPISLFDRGADSTSGSGWNPHSYHA